MTSMTYEQMKRFIAYDKKFKVSKKGKVVAKVALCKNPNPWNPFHWMRIRIVDPPIFLNKNSYREL